MNGEKLERAMRELELETQHSQFSLASKGPQGPGMSLPSPWRRGESSRVTLIV